MRRGSTVKHVDGSSCTEAEAKEGVGTAVLSRDFPVGDFVEGVVVHVADSLVRGGEYFEIQFIGGLLLDDFAKCVG